jgi:WD40 repeat protein
MIKLTGHRGSINCLDISSNDCNKVATGSNDKSIRLFDVRVGRTSKCICKIFPSSVEVVAFDVHDDNIIYSSSLNNFYSFDIRTEKMILTASLRELTNITHDDISGIACHPAGRYIGLSDDAGMITIIEPQQNYKTFTLPSSYNSIIGSLAFNDFYCDEISFGGFDCTVQSWNFTEQRFISSANLGRTNFLMDQQSINPPFIQSLGYLYKGRILACGIGNGQVWWIVTYDRLT